MKLITFILAFCVLACSVIPCCIMDDCKNEMTKEAKPKTQDDDCKGNCSPFFACGGCSGFTINTQEFTIEQVKFIEKTIYPDFYICSHTDYFPSFWQPPKIS